MCLTYVVNTCALSVSSACITSLLPLVVDMIACKHVFGRIGFATMYGSFYLEKVGNEKNLYLVELYTIELCGRNLYELVNFC